MMTDKTMVSDLPIPPGEYLEEVLLDLNMSKDELAKRMDRPASKLSAIFKGEKAITSETALQLEKVVGVPAHIWTGLESEYQLAKSRRQDQEQLAAQFPLIKRYCYKQLVNLGFCSERKDKKEQLEELHRFHGVTSLLNVNQIDRYQAAFRCGKTRSTKSSEATLSWLRTGEIRARSVECRPFCKAALKEIVPQLRSMTLDSLDAINNKLPEIFASSGVAFVLVEHFPGTFANGAVFWFSKEKAVLMASIRYKWADIFWFNIFHEIGHLLLHPDTLILECKEQHIDVPGREAEADGFAAEHLIPTAEYNRFAKQNDFGTSAMKAFADKIGIHVGIVVGRLQHDQIISKNACLDLRRKYEWV